MFDLNYNIYGAVYSVKDAIAKVIGLSKVTSGEMVVNREGSTGLALNLETDWTSVVMFHENTVMGGDQLTRTFKTLGIQTDPTMLSNVFDSLGVMLNKFNTLLKKDIDLLVNEFGVIWRGVELKAPGIIEREPVYETLFTGILGVDAVFPLGLGQRELIIGDRQTGKTAIASDCILNQSSVGVMVYRYIFKNQPGNISTIEN